MNRLGAVLVLLISCSGVAAEGQQGRGKKVVGVMNGKDVVTHYTTGPLSDEKSVQAVLELMGQLKKHAKGRFNWFNAGLGQEIRRQLSEDHDLCQVETMEQLLRAGAFVLVSTDLAIFVVRAEYGDILRDCLPNVSIEQGVPVYLPETFEEVSEALKEVSCCRENERIYAIEQKKLEGLRQERMRLEAVAAGLLREIEQVKNK